MKTFLLDIPDRFRRFDEQLDVKALLCNKSWQVFNDSGVKEIYIFQEDGSLIISLNGKVSRATWQYIPANRSLIINSDNESYMLRPFSKMKTCLHCNWMGHVNIRSCLMKHSELLSLWNHCLT